MSLRTLAVVPLLAVAALSAPRAARAETLACTEIASLPTLITSPGVYCLHGDLATSQEGIAVEVASSDVTIDCNGYKIGGLAAGNAATNSAVVANGRDNVVVRNCNLRGFRDGILMQGDGLTVEDNRIEAMRNVAVQLFGMGSVVRRNRIYDTGIHYVDSGVAAIMSNGPSYIVDNTIDTVVGAAGTDTSVAGIAMQGAQTGGVIAGNRVRGVSEDGAGYAIGIVVGGDQVVSIRGNTVTYIPGSTGISCGGGVVVHDSVAASNHVTGGLGLAIDKCTDGGGNLTR